MSDVAMLFDGKFYRARGSIKPDNAVIVVTFDHWSPTPTVHGAGYAEDYLRKRGYNWISIKTNVKFCSKTKSLTLASHLVRSAVFV